MLKHRTLLLRSRGVALAKILHWDIIKTSSNELKQIIVVYSMMKSLQPRLWHNWQVVWLVIVALVVSVSSLVIVTSAPAAAQTSTRITCADVLESGKCRQKVSQDCQLPAGAPRDSETRRTNSEECERKIVVDGVAKKTYTRKYSDANCGAKINKDRCQKEIDAQCKSSANKDVCMSSRIRKYKDVTPTCMNKENPQACHRAVVRQCGDDPPFGTTPSQGRVSCIDRAIGSFDNVNGPSVGRNPETQGQAKLDLSDGKSPGEYYCGNGDKKVRVKFNLGCLGVNYNKTSLGPIEDVLYAFLRFMSIGVGVAVIIAIAAAGIRYSTSQGNPEVTQSAKNNIQSAVIALIIYIFIFSIVQYLVPGGFFQPGMWFSPETSIITERVMH